MSGSIKSPTESECRDATFDRQHPSPSTRRSDAEKLLGSLTEKEIEIPEYLKRHILASTDELVGIDDGDRQLSPVSDNSHIVWLKEASVKKSAQEDDELIKKIQESIGRFNRKRTEFQVRVTDGSYTVVNYESERSNNQEVANVVSASLCYRLYDSIASCLVSGGKRKTKVETPIMEGVNLCLESGKMYLVLGAPGSGKSTLLKMIADTLHKSKSTVVGGKVSISGISPGKGVNWTKLVSYIDQIDRLHPFLTVKETLSFAWKCRTGGTHRLDADDKDPETEKIIADMDKQEYQVATVMEALGLTRVKDTFVGDQDRVRGVSGGEKKRVTVGEMFCCPTMVRCCDEISTGLDAAITFDITRLIGRLNRMTEKISLVSLLQPPPETVALFDDIILVSNGCVIYSGPVEQVEAYFAGLGYSIPERMDLADWLQAIPTPDGARFLRSDIEGLTHLNYKEFREKFYESTLGSKIIQELDLPIKSQGDKKFIELSKVGYANPWYKSLKLLISREALLWWRDKYSIKAKIVQTVVMGTVVGTVFYQQSSNPRTVLSVLFQSLFYALIGSMVLVRNQFFDRPAFYKQQDAMFFPSWSYILGRSLASIPNALVDAIGYGTFIFWLVGLAYNDGASIANYFIFLLLLFVTSLSAGLIFGVFSASVQNVTTSQACMAILALVYILFSGYTVQPDVIPGYYIWIYWLNCFAWLLRALAVNEFQSGKYNGPSGQPGYTEGDLILVRLGFTLDGEPFDFGWVWWGILFALACSLGSMLLTSFCLNNVRFATGLSLGDAVYDDAERTPPSSVQGALLPFQRGNLTFKNMHYVVTSSITKESLELLKGIDGVIESGKMLALMGSSGAGKSTLLDVLALRKTSGTIEGDVRLNGHPIEPSAFRRCIGYVEQFDVQSAQLTIRETADFSAKLRLDENTVSKESREKFVEETLSILEMTNIQHLQVGTDDSGGLSFEQRKRLSILNELVSNPAIIFLDEPTSGLDSRAASIVMRGLKRIALSGRAVCATIHQPSIAIFNEFDTLLLLKRGGEVVYHGPIGDASCDLIRYLERYKDTPKIMPGENPATWMLKVIGAGREARTKPFDYTGSYAVSDLHFQCLEKIEEIYINATEENKVAFKEVHAASNRTQLLTVFQKGWLVYFRSPSYNTVRMTVSGIIALLFSSVYASSQIPTTESDMASRINSIFISVLFMLVNAQNTVLGVFENERNMFYRHKSANMYGASAVLVAYTLAEIPFILLTSIIFCVLFYFIMGFELAAEAFFIFFLFVTLGIATFTFCGQMLVSLVKDAKTAQSLGGLIVSFTSLFSGVLIPPQSIPEFWSFMYWIMPGHWIMEGLFTSQYGSSQLPIEASVDSPFYVSLGCNNTNDPCVGTAGEWLAVSFPDFSESHIKWDATFLVIVMIITRAVALTALSFLNYRST